MCKGYATQEYLEGLCVLFGLALHVGFRLCLKGGQLLVLLLQLLLQLLDCVLHGLHLHTVHVHVPGRCAAAML